MEKIYMNEQQDNKKKKNKKLKQSSSVSVVVSFVLAIVAIISLVAYGFGNVSFAADEPVRPEVEEFIVDQTTPREYTLTGGAENSFIVQVHSAKNGSNNLFVLCLEYGKDLASDKSNTLRDKITDKGLNYLLLNLNQNVITKDDGSEVGTNDANALKQALVWMYQKSVNAANSDRDSAPIDVEGLRESTSLALRESGTAVLTSGSGIFRTCRINGGSLLDLLDKAIRVHNGDTSLYSERYLNFDTTNASDIKLSDDGKYYITGKITIKKLPQTVSTLKALTIDKSNLPEGTLIMKTNGEAYGDEELTINGDSFVDGTELYLKVPTNKVTEETLKFKLGYKEEIMRNVGYYFINRDNGDDQKVGYVQKVTEVNPYPAEIDFKLKVDAPDTGFGRAQVIYFVGLIILLAGVGIIYANVKPAKSAQ